jgi:hypothetical protein
MTATASPDDDDLTPEEIADAIEKARADRRALKAADPTLPRKALSEMSSAEVSREVLDAIHRHVDPDKVGRVINRMLDAKRTLKNGTILEDTRAQDAAAKLYISYTVGTPVQRSESVSVTLDADSSLGLRERLAHSPALRKVLRSMLEEVENVPE